MRISTRLPRATALGTDVRRTTGEPLPRVTEPLAARDHPLRDSRKQVQAVWRGTCVRKPWPTSVTVVGSLTDS